MNNKVNSYHSKVIVKVTPKASMNKLVILDPISNDIFAFKAMVTAVPEQGKANTAVINLIAKELGFSKSQIKLTQGATARMKTILIYSDKQEIISKINKYSGKQ